MAWSGFLTWAQEKGNRNHDKSLNRLGHVRGQKPGPDKGRTCWNCMLRAAPLLSLLWCFLWTLHILFLLYLPFQVSRLSFFSCLFVTFSLCSFLFPHFYFLAFVLILSELKCMWCIRGFSSCFEVQKRPSWVFLTKNP